VVLDYTGRGKLKAASFNHLGTLNEYVVHSVQIRKLQQASLALYLDRYSRPVDDKININ
jgi:hypothetical protein